MPLVNIIIVLVVLGLVWWLFTTYILPRVPEPFKTIIIVVIVMVIILWLLAAIGMINVPVTKPLIR